MKISIINLGINNIKSQLSNLEDCRAALRVAPEQQTDATIEGETTDGRA